MAGNQYLAAGIANGLDGLSSTLLGFYDRERQNERNAAQDARYAAEAARQNIIDQAAMRRYQRQEEEERLRRRAEEEDAANWGQFSQKLQGYRARNYEPNDNEIFALADSTNVLRNPRYLDMMDRRLNRAKLDQSGALAQQRIDAQESRFIKTYELNRQKLAEAKRKAKTQEELDAAEFNFDKEMGESLKKYREAMAAKSNGDFVVINGRAVPKQTEPTRDQLNRIDALFDLRKTARGTDKKELNKRIFRLADEAGISIDGLRRVGENVLADKMEEIYNSPEWRSF
jgi:hypothetical protein